MKAIGKIFSKEFIIGFVIMLLTVTAFVFKWDPIEGLEYRFYDFGVNMRGKASSAPVAVVEIDDISIAKMGRWPWPRSYIAEMIDNLKNYEAKVIGINILYSETDYNQGLWEVQEIIKKIEADYSKTKQVNDLYTLLKESEKRLDNDTVLSTSITASNKVVLPSFFTLSKTLEGGEVKLPNYLQNNSIPLTTSPTAFLTANEIIPPIPALAQHAMALGHINLVNDSDKAVRSEPLLIAFGNRIFPSFGLQLVMSYLNYELKDIVPARTVRIRDIKIPTTEKSKMLISFNKKIPIYSFLDVIDNKVPPDHFKNKIVIIAGSATGIATTLMTPIGANMPSWVIVANVVDNILSNTHIVRPAWAFYVELALIILFGIFLAFIFPKLHAGINAIISVILFFGWSAIAWFLLVKYGYWFKVVYPSLMLVVGYIAVVSCRYLFTERAKERVEADSVETNKMLGLSFQGQGMLDMAFDKFRKCPIEDTSVKDLIYNLGLDFERKRMFNKAVSAYEHVMQDGEYKDITERIKKLKTVGDTVMFGATGAKKDATVLIDGAETKPTLGRYEIAKELGRGAMGTVYLGKDPRINREVAIKTLRYDDFEEDQVAELKKRFFREAEAAGKLSHPNIVTIYDVGEDYEIAYMAMELLDGSDLSDYCQKDRLMPLKEVARVITSVAQALDYAHENGVVHRDIKPANIMLLKNGEIKVADFGIARVMSSSKTQTGVIMGTPSYMSPEQISGQKVDGRSDLFSLGVVFYELLSGEKPFGGDNITTLMFNITNSPPILLKDVAPDAPQFCEEIIMKLLNKNKDDRYQHGRELAAEITAYMEKTGEAN
ncbi:MAG: serine/threonine-protein kinase [Proteobacteria bacterium]|nr:serine/threonine-protein kinase [Pseudomonadota bacterium]